MDDSLSALDAYVGKQIMDNVFQGELKGKTVIMVTHYLNLLNKGDRVALVIDGTVPIFESYSEIQKRKEFLEFSTLVEKEYEITEKDAEEEGYEHSKIKRESIEAIGSLTKHKVPMKKLPPMDQKLAIKPALLFENKEEESKKLDESKIEEPTDRSRHKAEENKESENEFEKEKNDKES